MNWYVAYLFTILKQELSKKQSDSAINLFAEKVLPIVEAFLTNKQDKIAQAARDLQKIVTDTPENFFATFLLATCYKIELGLSQDVKRSLELYQQSAKSGYVHAIRGLALCHIQGIGVAENSENLAKGIALLNEAVSKDDAFAMVELAEHYENGRGVKEDIAVASDLISKAVKKGNPRAQFDMSIELYKHRKRLAEKTCVGEERQNVRALIKQAMDLCEKAAEQNHPVANFQMGLFHFEGNFVPKDLSIASYFFLKAEPLLKDEENFYILARVQEILAGILVQGIPTQEEREKAADYLMQALDNRLLNEPTDPKIAEIKEGIYSVAQSFEAGGAGYKQNKKLAQTMYKKLADLGLSKAAYRLKALSDAPKAGSGNDAGSKAGAGKDNQNKSNGTPDASGDLNPFMSLASFQKWRESQGADRKGDKEADALGNNFELISGSQPVDALDRVNHNFRKHMRTIQSQLDSISRTLNVRNKY